MPRYRITISGRDSRDADLLAELARTHGLDLLDHGVRGSRATGFSIDAIVDAAKIAPIEAAGLGVRRHEDVDQVGRERQKEVGQGNRFARDGPPSGQPGPPTGPPSPPPGASGQGSASPTRREQGDRRKGA